MAVHVIGFAELQKRIQQIADGLSDDSSSAIYLAAVRNIANVARRNAPVGNHPTEGKNHPGRLRESIMARSFGQGATRRFGPGAFSQVTMTRGLRTAPYGHIVESGRMAVSRIGEGKGKKRMFVFATNAGTFVFTKKVRGFAGRKFFERAVESSGPRELELAANRLNSLLKRKYELY